jgi:hypothetical protein
MNRDELVQKVAFEAYRADSIEGSNLDLSGMEWELSWARSAEMPLSGPGFVKRWTAIAKPVTDLILEEAAQIADAEASCEGIAQRIAANIRALKGNSQ